MFDNRMHGICEKTARVPALLENQTLEASVMERLSPGSCATVFWKSFEAEVSAAVGHGASRAPQVLACIKFLLAILAHFLAKNRAAFPNVGCSMGRAWGVV